MVYLLEGTVPTGLEITSLEEVKEKLQTTGTIARGRLFFEVSHIANIPKILRFGSFEHVNVVLLKTKDVKFLSDKAKCFCQLRNLVSLTNWSDGLEAWQSCNGPIPGSMSKVLKRFEEYKLKKLNNIDCELPSTDVDLDGPRFRVTCFREGKDFVFTSDEAAYHFGGEIHNCFRWKADMENFTLEIILRINKDETIVCIPLNKFSLCFRNLVARGPTCLKGSICYGLLTLCKLQPGDIVCDPMMGSGSLLLEGNMNWPQCQYIGGDCWPQSPDYCFRNKLYLNSKLVEMGRNSSNIELFAWDAEKLPLKTFSVDCFVTDLPFGKRIGSQSDNRQLYLKVLKEMARALKLSSGRAVLLTYDRRSMVKTLQNLNKYLKLHHSLVINVGGLFSAVYVLHRTLIEYQ